LTDKYFFYVDETGQDTEGTLFIVAPVITPAERQELYPLCEQAEVESQKGRRKWTKSSPDRRLAYVQRILTSPLLKKKIFYAIYLAENDYTQATLRTIVQAHIIAVTPESEVTIFIDGLPRSIERMMGLRLRRAGLPVKKVRGLNDEE
jgi:hypothetical protein